MPISSEQHHLIWLACPPRGKKNKRKEIWSEELLSGHTFAFTIDNVLNKRERQILQSKIDGMSDLEISKLFNVEVGTIVGYKSAIISKFKNGIEIHPQRHLGKYLRKRKKR